MVSFSSLRLTPEGRLQPVTFTYSGDALHEKLFDAHASGAQAHDTPLHAVRCGLRNAKFCLHYSAQLAPRLGQLPTKLFFPDSKVDRPVAECPGYKCVFVFRPDLADQLIVLSLHLSLEKDARDYLRTQPNRVACQLVSDQQRRDRVKFIFGSVIVIRRQLMGQRADLSMEEFQKLTKDVKDFRVMFEAEPKPARDLSVLRTMPAPWAPETSLPVKRTAKAAAAWTAPPSKLDDDCLSTAAVSVASELEAVSVIQSPSPASQTKPPADWSTEEVAAWLWTLDNGAGKWDRRCQRGGDLNSKGFPHVFRVQLGLGYFALQVRGPLSGEPD